MSPLHNPILREKKAERQNNETKEFPQAGLVVFAWVFAHVWKIGRYFSSFDSTVMVVWGTKKFYFEEKKTSHFTREKGCERQNNASKKRVSLDRSGHFS